MTQRFYEKEVLKYHIDHLKWLQAKYKRRFWFQEHNDPSHGTKIENNVAAIAKRASWIRTLAHPAQSPCLNPIEGIWNLIKQRLRGGSWKTVQEFKDAIQAEWRKIQLSEIRKRISEMPRRCRNLTKNSGNRIKSRLW
jgi:hypothetical protein